MDLSSAQSGRTYTALPIDPTLGFPQSFSFALDGVTYFFTLYVDIAATALDSATTDLFSLPAANAFLVARVDTQNSDGTGNTIFLRKVTPELEYLTENISLYFPQQVVARQNLNGQGSFGSSVMGGIAPRWA
jgi:hypothetical protein